MLNCGPYQFFYFMNMLFFRPNHFLLDALSFQEEHHHLIEVINLHFLFIRLLHT